MPHQAIYFPMVALAITLALVLLVKKKNLRP